MGDFWRGAVGTKKQKIFWVVFSIIVAIVALVIIGVLAPPVAFEETVLQAEEWTHLYPDSFWHESASITMKTIPLKGGKSENVAFNSYVYDMGVHGKALDFEWKAVDDSFVLGKICDGMWAASVYMNFKSSVSITIQPTSAPLDFLATTSKDVFDKWAVDGSIEDESAAIDYRSHVQQISSTVEIDGVDRFLYGQRVYFGVMVSPDSPVCGSTSLSFKCSLTKVSLVNSTSFSGDSATFPFNSLSVLQINAPSVCTSNSTNGCTVQVWLNARWVLFALVVVLPVIVISVGLVIGLMALKALHVRQMIAYMRKKADEEGIALEEGKSKDIHAEKLDDGSEEAEHHEEDEEAEADKPADDDEHQEEAAEKEEKGGAAVLSSAADGEDEH